MRVRVLYRRVAVLGCWAGVQLRVQRHVHRNLLPRSQLSSRFRSSRKHGSRRYQMVHDAVRIKKSHGEPLAVDFAVRQYVRLTHNPNSL